MWGCVWASKACNTPEAYGHRETPRSCWTDGLKGLQVWCCDHRVCKNAQRQCQLFRNLRLFIILMGKLYLLKPLWILNPTKSKSIRTPVLLFAQPHIHEEQLTRLCFWLPAGAPTSTASPQYLGKGLDLAKNHMKKFSKEAKRVVTFGAI